MSSLPHLMCRYDCMFIHNAVTFAGTFVIRVKISTETLSANGYRPLPDKFVLNLEQTQQSDVSLRTKLFLTTFQCFTDSLQKLGNENPSRTI